MLIEELFSGPLLTPKQQDLCRSRVVASAVIVEELGECWTWTFGTTPEGYGQASVAGRHWFIHRLAYTMAVGPIPRGLQLDHLCRNPPCVRPSHLEPVTIRVNVVERGAGTSAVNAAKTRCIRGHQFDYVTPNGRRQCWTCANMRARAHRRGESLAS